MDAVGSDVKIQKASTGNQAPAQPSYTQKPNQNYGNARYTNGRGNSIAQGLPNTKNLSKSGSRVDANGRIVPNVPNSAVATNGAALTNGPKLLPTEGNVGTYRDLVKAGSVGDNITPNHIPSANRMAVEGISRGDGIAINIEQPVPGVGGRHRATFTYGIQADINMTPRDALPAGVWDARAIYRADGLYTPVIRSALQELIQMNKTNYPTIFVK